MANGTIALTRTGSGYLTGQIVWSSVGNGTAANTSTVTATLQLQRSALNDTTGTFKGTFTVGGVSETISWYGTLPSYTWVSIKTITTTVSHNADGNGSCYVYALMNGPTGTTMEGTSVSGSSTVTLEWIPRYATILSATDFTDEENPVITYSNPAGESVDDLQVWISLDGSSVLTNRSLPKTGKSYTFELNVPERNALRSATPDSNTLMLYFYVRTEISGSVFNTSTKATMRIVNADPTISPVVVDTNSATIAVTGNRSILVAMHSTASVTVNAEAKKYATIKNQRVEHGAAVLPGDGTLSVTNNPIKFTITDSRGNTVSQYAANTIVPYINPTCAIGNNLPEADGSFALVVTGLFYNGKIGATANALTVQYRYKAANGSYGSWSTFGTVTKSGNRYTATKNLTGLDYQTVYTFQARVIDSLHTGGVNSAAKALIAEPVFDWGKNDFKFNVPVNLKSGCEIMRNGVVAYYKRQGTRNSSSGVTDFDLLTELGSYWIQGKGMTNGPIDSATTYFGTLEVINTGSSILQRFSRYGNNGTIAVYERDNVNGWKYTWTRTDGVPDKMVFGTYYATNELWNGKVAYKKLVNLGTLPVSGRKHIAIGSVNVQEGATPVSFEAYASNGTEVHDMTSTSFGSAGHAFLWTNGAQWYVDVNCASDLSAWTGTAVVKWVYN